MDLLHKICLVGEIKGLSEEIKRTRKIMYSVKMEYKPFWQRVKYGVKSNARHYALAYAYLRKIPYNVVEKKCREKPNAETILKIVMLHSYFTSFTFYKDGLANVNAWLEDKV